MTEHLRDLARKMLKEDWGLTPSRVSDFGVGSTAFQTAGGGQVQLLVVDRLAEWTEAHSGALQRGMEAAQGFAVVVHAGPVAQAALRANGAPGARVHVVEGAALVAAAQSVRRPVLLEVRDDTCRELGVASLEELKKLRVEAPEAQILRAAPGDLVGYPPPDWAPAEGGAFGFTDQWTVRVVVQ